MRRAPFVQADVFSASPFGGNPVVVITDAREMSEADMAAVAAGMNFAETGFVLPPTLASADIWVRFFTPATEVPFSGHLALGAAHALLTHPGGPFESRARLVMETAVGRLPVDAEFEAERLTRVSVTERPPVFGPALSDVAGLAEALGLDAGRLGASGLPPQIVTTSLPTLAVPLPTRADVGDLTPDAESLNAVCQACGATVVAVFTRDTLRPDDTLYVRVFAPLLGVPEDAATGSANAALGAYLVHHGALAGAPPARIRAEQGYTLGRPSLVQVDVVAGAGGLEVHVGGHVAQAAEGIIYY